MFGKYYEEKKIEKSKKKVFSASIPIKILESFDLLHDTDKRSNFFEEAYLDIRHDLKKIRKKPKKTSEIKIISISIECDYWEDLGRFKEDKMFTSKAEIVRFVMLTKIIKEMKK